MILSVKGMQACLVGVRWCVPTTDDAEGQTLSLQSVEQHARTVAESRGQTSALEAALRAECRAANVAGVPIAAIARAAGVTRVTMYQWLKEQA